jgi:two-component system, LytTR family, response regulator LytT
MIKVLIVEDEFPAAERLQRLLAETGSSMEVVAVTDSVSSTVKWLKNNAHPHLMFLDIQLGDGISFEIFKQVQCDSFVVFTTAYDEYAIKAFELNSVDYLLKPVKKELLIKSIEKYHRLADKTPHFPIDDVLQYIASRKQQKSRFVINIGNKLKTVETRDVALFYTLEKSTFLCSFDGKNYPIDFSLDTLESMVPNEQFFRINRQMIVNFGAIKKIHILSKSRVKLDLSVECTQETFVSFAKTSEFKTWLER